MKINAYNILGISLDATPNEVKQAYVRLAKQYHPDVCKEPHALDWMKTINLAYEAIKENRGRWWSPPFSHMMADPPREQTLAERIQWANTHLVDDDYLTRIFVGGRDTYSEIHLSGLETRAGADIAEKVRNAILYDKLRSIALRWYLRGLNVDLAIRKARADNLLYRDRTKNAS